MGDYRVRLAKGKKGRNFSSVRNKWGIGRRKPFTAVRLGTKKLGVEGEREVQTKGQRG